jgi:hypothetical protein
MTFLDLAENIAIIFRKLADVVLLLLTLISLGPIRDVAYNPCPAECNRTKSHTKQPQGKVEPKRDPDAL